MRLSRRIGLLWMPVALLAISLMIIPLALPEKAVAWCDQSLSVDSSPVDGGTIQVQPEEEKYFPEDNIILLAIPAEGYIFENWTGNVEGIADPSQNPLTFTMGDNPDDERSITATFILDTRPSTTYSLSTIVEPGSGGSVEVEPSGNEEVTLSAMAQPGYIFSHWMGDVSDQNSASTTVTMNNDKTVIAIFNVTLTANCSPDEGGSITMSPIQPAEGYTAGTKVTMVATAAKDYRFISWEGDVSSTSSLIEVTAYVPTSITARFEKLPGPSLVSSLWWLWMTVGIFSSVSLVILLILRRRASQT